MEQQSSTVVGCRVGYIKLLELPPRSSYIKHCMAGTFDQKRKAMGELVDSVFAMDLKDTTFWLAFAAVIMHAAIWRYIVIWECVNLRLANSLGTRKQAGYVVSAAILLLGTVRFFLVMFAIGSQPRWIYFHDNRLLVLGQMSIVIGFVLLVSSANARGFPQCVVCVHFDVYGEGYFRGQTFPYNVLKEPVSVATVLVHIGISLLKASQAGIILSLLMLSSGC